MIIKWKSNLIFGDVNLSDYEAFAFHKNHYDGAERDVELISVPGRNGDLIIDNKRYKNMDVEYRAKISGQTNAHFLRAALLSQIGYQRIEDDYEPEMYRIGRLKQPPEMNQSVIDAVSMTLTFDCKPQRYLKSGEVEKEFTTNGNIYNPTLYNARPLVRVYGYGEVGIGGNTITIVPPASGETRTYIDIDCDLQDAYTGTTNQNGKIELSSGKFFELAPGENGVSLDTHITKVIITPRWETQ